jgi:thiamine-phosphate pyrophosphorylase
MSRNFDPSVYFVTDSAIAGGRSIEEVVAAAVAGGVRLVEYRRPGAPTRVMVDEARRLVGFLRPLGIPLIVDDRIDVVLAADADGAHLVADAMRPADARRLVGPDRILGASCGTPARLADLGAEIDLVDYVSVGPIFATPTLPSAGAGIGFGAIPVMRRLIDRPLVAIAGIRPDNAGEAIAAGAAGVAVVSAITAATDPEAAARALVEAVAAARRRS